MTKNRRNAICVKKDFEQALQLKTEKHLRTHEYAQIFECKICAKTFTFKWTMKKHVEKHENPIVRCHYFNNKKSCPYKELGCIFVHNYS